MKIGVFGTGMVGSAIATKLAALGHEVMMGSRKAGGEKALAWVKAAGARASEGSFADAASFGELVFNCTNGAGALEVVSAAGAANLKGKVLADVSNPLDFSKGRPPSLFVLGDDSLAERIQRAVPETRVVKTLNTMNCELMVNPARIQGEHDVFVSGNDAAAKAQVGELLKSFGWRNVVDLGDLSTARGTEAYVLFWLRAWGALKTADFNVHLVR